LLEAGRSGGGDGRRVAYGPSGSEGGQAKSGQGRPWSKLVMDGGGRERRPPPRGALSSSALLVLTPTVAVGREREGGGGRRGMKGS